MPSVIVVVFIEHEGPRTACAAWERGDNVHVVGVPGTMMSVGEQTQGGNETSKRNATQDQTSKGTLVACKPVPMVQVLSVECRATQREVHSHIATACIRAERISRDDLSESP